MKFHNRTFSCSPGVTDDLLHGEGAIIGPHFDPKPGEVFFDVGAANSTWTVYALASGCETYAFEPSLPHYEAMYQEVSGRSWPAEWHLFRLGLDNERSTKTLAKWYTDLGGPDGLELTPDCLEDVDFKPLDDWLPELTRLDWIKIDVEAGELRVMQGGAGAIRKFRPKMIIENHINIVRMGPWMRENRIVEQMVEMLVGLGYEVTEVPHQGRSFLIGRPR